MDYSIKNEAGEFLTGDIQTGRYAWTKNPEFRYVVTEERMKIIIRLYPGSYPVPEVEKTGGDGLQSELISLNKEWWQCHNRIESINKRRKEINAELMNIELNKRGK